MMTTRDTCLEIGKALWTESHVNYTILLQFTVSDKRICELSIKEAKINKNHVFITLHNYSFDWHPTIVHKIEDESLQMPPKRWPMEIYWKQDYKFILLDSRLSFKFAFRQHKASKISLFPSTFFLYLKTYRRWMFWIYTFELIVP